MVIERIVNDARDYAWGSRTLMSELLALPETGKPMAEVWFGTHPLSPARTVDGTSLADLRAEPLGFLLKYLAAEKPLSIQVHPSKTQAEAGFARENEAGIGIEADNRLYKDPNPKSESLVAISEFEVLAGIKNAESVRQTLESLRSYVSAKSAELEHLIEVCASNPDGLYAEVLTGSLDYAGLTAELAANLGEPSRSEHELLTDIFDSFGPDKGALLALFMRHIILEPGQALVVPPGTPHSYLRGLGLEIQDNSDNVMRAGLTPKHVDAEEFLAVLDVAVAKAATVREAKELVRGLWVYPQISESYCLHRVEVGASNLLADIKLPGDSIVVCISGEVAVSNSLGERITLRRGEAAYVSADANFFTFAGSGTAYIGSEL